MIPLVVRGQRIGLVILSYPVEHYWPKPALHPYQITAAQLATAIYSRQQQTHIADSERQMAVFEERRRLARDLHDSVTQLLFSITLVAQSVGSAWRRSQAEGEARLQRLLELSQAALAEMRALLVELRPPERSLLQPPPPLPIPLPPSIVQVQQEGLPAALRTHLTTIGREGLHIELDAAAYSAQPADLEETLFRVVQESLNNVVKHARASQVHIGLVTAGDHTRLTVHDNGIGFDPSAGRQRGGMGLQGMRERTTAQGGELRIVSTPGQGTTVEMVLPAATPPASRDEP
jgi:signal transduction histidine kinase